MTTKPDDKSHEYATGFRYAFGAVFGVFISLALVLAIMKAVKLAHEATGYLWGLL